jgi:hypothetical protein
MKSLLNEKSSVRACSEIVCSCHRQAFAAIAESSHAQASDDSGSVLSLTHKSRERMCIPRRAGKLTSVELHSL